MRTSLAFDDLRLERPAKHRAELVHIRALVCVEARDGASRGIPTVAEEALLTCQTVLCILGCALLFVCILLPTSMMWMPWEIHMAYFHSFVAGVSLMWSSNTRYMCFGNQTPLCVRCGAWMLGAVLYMCLLMLCSGESEQLVWHIAVVYMGSFQLACVFFECPQVVVKHHSTQAQCMKTAWAFIAGTALGALPCMVVVPIYITVWRWKSTSDHPLAMTILVLLWVLLQVLLRWSGVHIWRTACQIAPHLGHLFWVLYVELVLGLLGIGIFMRTMGSALAFSLSTATVMAAITIRGLHAGRYAPGTAALMEQRVVLFLEIYVSLASKMSVFVVYVVHASTEVAFGSTLALRERAVRSTMSGGSRPVPNPFPVILFKRLRTSGSFDIVIGLTCCAIPAVFSMITWRLLPMVWKCERTSQRNRISPELVGAQSCRTICTTTSSHHSDDVKTSASSNPSSGNHDRADPSCGVDEAPRRSDTSSGWLPADSGSTVASSQIRLLRAFASDNLYNLVSFWCFTMCLVILMMSTVDTLPDFA